MSSRMSLSLPAYARCPVETGGSSGRASAIRRRAGRKKPGGDSDRPAFAGPRPTTGREDTGCAACADERQQQEKHSADIGDDTEPSGRLHRRLTNPFALGRADRPSSGTKAPQTDAFGGGGRDHRHEQQHCLSWKHLAKQARKVRSVSKGLQARSLSEKMATARYALPSPPVTRTVPHSTQAWAIISPVSGLRLTPIERMKGR